MMQEERRSKNISIECTRVDNNSLELTGNAGSLTENDQPEQKAYRRSSVQDVSFTEN